MEYRVKTLHLKQRMEEMDNDDQEFTAILNEFAEKGYYLERILFDERFTPIGNAKNTYLLIFRR